MVLVKIIMDITNKYSFAKLQYLDLRMHWIIKHLKWLVLW